MKTIRTATLTSLALTFSLILQAQDATRPVPESAPESEAAFSPAVILEAWGWYLGQQIDLVGLGLGEDEVNALSRGLQIAARGKEPAIDLEQIAPYVQEYLTSRAESVQNERSSAGRDAAAAYFSELDANAAVISLASGLRYEVIEQGTGAYPSAEDMVVVHYTGKLLDGTVFDSADSLTFTIPI